MSSQNHLLLSPLMLPSAFFRKQRASLQTFGHFMVGWAKMESGPKNSQFRFNGLNIFSFRTNVIKILFISQACQNGLFLLSLKSLKEGISVCKFTEKSHFTRFCDSYVISKHLNFCAKLRTLWLSENSVEIFLIFLKHCAKIPRSWRPGGSPIIDRTWKLWQKGQTCQHIFVVFSSLYFKLKVCKIC